jgi:hypothetical protein
MVRKQTIPLRIDANAATRRGAIVMTADLSDREIDELRAINGQIRFEVPSGTPVVNPNDPRSVTWTIPGNLAYGEHPVAVELIADGKPIARNEARIYVFEPAGLALADMPEVDEGERIQLEVTASSKNPLPPSFLTAMKSGDLRFDWVTGNKGVVKPVDPDDPKRDPHKALWHTAGMNAGAHNITARLVDPKGNVLQSRSGPMTATGEGRIATSPLTRTDTLRVALQRSSSVRTRHDAFWSLIRSCTTAIGGRNYLNFIDKVLCPDPERPDRNPPLIVRRLGQHARDVQAFTYGVGAYELLKTATQIFLLLECGGCHADIKNFDPDEESRRLGETVTVDQIRERLRIYLSTGHLPYIDRVLESAFRGEDEISGLHCYGVLNSRIQVPCLIELIWSYWNEEGMLVQTINAITRRFQNVRGPGDRDPLAHLEIDPLRPLNNLLWGYLQDEQNLLTLKRRAYEYDHHYGLTIYGKAVPTLRPADSRSKFLEAFHHLLHRTSVFYREDNDTTVIADGFPLLNALKEVHLLLAQGAHNQFGDLPWTARAEMLVQQWLLARPEMRDFLQSRHMVPYQEPWMAQVDTMKALQGWTDITVTHFRDLAVYGEQIVLTVRYGDWIDINDEDAARNWARYWRPEIQGYLHAYRAVTGIDLTNPDTVDHTLPAVHLQKRLAMQRAR